MGRSRSEKQETPRGGATTIDELTLLLAGNFTRSADPDVRTSQNVTTRRLAAHFAWLRRQLIGRTHDGGGDSSVNRTVLQCWQLLAAQFGVRSRYPVIVRVFARCHHR